MEAAHLAAALPAVEAAQPAATNTTATEQAAVDTAVDKAAMGVAAAGAAGASQGAVPQIQQWVVDKAGMDAGSYSNNKINEAAAEQATTKATVDTVAADI